MTSVPDFSGTKLCQASKQELSEPTNFLQGAEKANLVQKVRRGEGEDVRVSREAPKCSLASP